MRIFLSIFYCVCVVAFTIIVKTETVFAQDSTQLTQSVAIDLYSALRQKGRPEAIAIRIQKAVQHFRYKCIRVNEYQIYNTRPNMIELKVGCISSPAYGVSVAANGYISVYGGNGMLEAISPNDGRVYAFNADGSLQPQIVPEFRQYLNRTIETVKKGDRSSQLYLIVLMPVILLIILIGIIMWLRSWRRIRYSGAYNNFLPSSLKDQLVTESQEVKRHIFKHPLGFFIAIGKRGKRRLFKRYYQAWLYSRLSMKIGEMVSIPKTDEPEEEEDY